MKARIVVTAPADAGMANILARRELDEAA